MLTEVFACDALAIQHEIWTVCLGGSLEPWGSVTGQNLFYHRKSSTRGPNDPGFWTMPPRSRNMSLVIDYFAPHVGTGLHATFNRRTRLYKMFQEAANPGEFEYGAQIDERGQQIARRFW